MIKSLILALCLTFSSNLLIGQDTIVKHKYEYLELTGYRIAFKPKKSKIHYYYKEKLKTQKDIESDKIISVAVKDKSLASAANKLSEYGWELQESQIFYHGDTRAKYWILRRDISNSE